MRVPCLMAERSCASCNSALSTVASNRCCSRTVPSTTAASRSDLRSVPIRVSVRLYGSRKIGSRVVA